MEYTLKDFQLLGNWKEQTQKSFAGLLAYDENARILMQLRDDIPTIPSPAQWALFGGEIETDETPIQAIKREIQEELGVTFDETQFRPALRYIGTKSANQFFLFTLAKTIAPQDIRLNEGAGFAFLTRAQIESYPLSASIRDAVLHHLSKQ